MLNLLVESIKHGAGPRHDNMSKSITISAWDQVEKHYQDYMPKKIEMLGKFMGMRIWKDGCYPCNTTFIEECDNLNSNADTLYKPCTLPPIRLSAFGIVYSRMFLKRPFAKIDLLPFLDPLNIS